MLLLPLSVSGKCIKLLCLACKNVLIHIHKLICQLLFTCRREELYGCTYFSGLSHLSVASSVVFVLFVHRIACGSMLVSFCQWLAQICYTLAVCQCNGLTLFLSQLARFWSFRCWITSYPHYSFIKAAVNL